VFQLDCGKNAETGSAGSRLQVSGLLIALHNLNCILTGRPICRSFFLSLAINRTSSFLCMFASVKSVYMMPEYRINGGNCIVRRISVAFTR
jgi:hypothetical protein